MGGVVVELPVVGENIPQLFTRVLNEIFGGLHVFQHALQTLLIDLVRVKFGLQRYFIFCNALELCLLGQENTAQNEERQDKEQYNITRPNPYAGLWALCLLVCHVMYHSIPNRKKKENAISVFKKVTGMTRVSAIYEMPFPSIVTKI